MAALVGAAELWRYEAGEIIAERGDPATGLWLVATGSLASYRSSPTGRYMLQGVLWSGQMNGLMPVLDGGPMPLSAAARTQALVVFIPRMALLEILKDNTCLWSLANYACIRSRIEYESIYTKTMDSIRCQLAKFLAYLPRRTIYLSEGPPDGPDWIDPSPVNLTQDELASMLGVARQTINRLMAPLLRDNIVVRDGDSIRVVDFKGLLAIMEEDEPLPPEWRAEILGWDEKLREARQEPRSDKRDGTHLLDRA